MTGKPGDPNIPRQAKQYSWKDRKKLVEKYGPQDFRRVDDPDRWENKSAAWAEQHGYGADPVSDALSRLAEKLDSLKGNEKAARDNLEFYARHVIQQDNQ